MEQCSFITTTSFGTWLPGNARGYVQKGQLLPPAPMLEKFLAERLSSPPITFNAEERFRLFASLCQAAEEFNYDLTDVSVESWHLHWIVTHNDGVRAMVGRLKNRMRQAIDRGRIWTKGFHFHTLDDDAKLFTARNYIGRHNGVRMINGQIVPQKPIP